MKKSTLLALATLASTIICGQGYAQSDDFKQKIFAQKPVPQPSMEIDNSDNNSGPNDPMFSFQYPYMHSTDNESTVGHSFMNSWKNSFETELKKIRVGVIDSGFAPHPDISYANDGADLYDGDNDPFAEQHIRDTEGCSAHGTSVSSIIGAISNNGAGIFGAGNNVEQL